MENVVLRNGTLTVEISPMGAELQSVRDANGVERLWDGDPAFWTGRAPVLFPVAGGMKNDQYRLEEAIYTLGKHGFARTRPFAVEMADDESATFVLTGDAGYDDGFPFDYAFRVRYILAGDALRVQYITQNLGDKTFWYGVGAHEAYACPEGIDAYEIAFDRPEALETLVLDRGLLTRDTEPVPLAEGRILKLHDGLFSHDTLVFANHASRSVTLQSTANSRKTRVDFADFDYLLIWKKPGANYICIEPWTNLPDYLDTDQDVTRKPGMIRLAPGEQRVILHTIAFQ